MPLVLENPYYSVELDEARSLLRITRSAARFPSALEYERELSGVIRFASLFAPRPRGMLFDLRLAPIRTDAASEEIIQRLAPSLYALEASFARAVTLVRTAVGGLQIKRQHQEFRRSVMVCQSEEEALAFLTET